VKKMGLAGMAGAGGKGSLANAPITEADLAVGLKESLVGLGDATKQDPNIEVPANGTTLTSSEDSVSVLFLFLLTCLLS
jgi:hypothetical protein